MVGFILFWMVLALCEIQTVLSRFWTRFAVSISYDVNYCTTNASQSTCIYVCVCMYECVRACVYVCVSAVTVSRRSPQFSLHNSISVVTQICLLGLSPNFGNINPQLLPCSQWWVKRHLWMSVTPPTHIHTHTPPNLLFDVFCFSLLLSFWSIGACLF